MKLSVVILNYNVCHFLELCLKSVQKAIRNIDAEIIVVDNASSDGSCQMVSSNFSEVLLIQNADNVGFSKGNNIGVEKARGEYLCILNPDTVVAEDTFTQLLKFSESDENIGAVGCQLIDGTGCFLPESKRNIPTPLVSLRKTIGLDKTYYVNQVPKDAIGQADILVGAFMFLRTGLYRQVGGFDTDYFMYGDDIDLSYKIKQKGYINYYYGKTSVIHFKGESTMKDVLYAKRFYGAMQIFYKKHFKSNIIFNALVWIGIKFAMILKKSKKSYVTTVKHTYVISDRLEKDLEYVLKKPIELLGKPLEHFPNQSQIVYDCDYVDFKSIILQMKNLSKHSNLVFRFLLKNSKFILGSDSSVTKGEITKY